MLMSSLNQNQQSPWILTQYRLDSRVEVGTKLEQNPGAYIQAVVPVIKYIVPYEPLFLGRCYFINNVRLAFYNLVDRVFIARKLVIAITVGIDD